MIITNKQFPNYRKYEMMYEGRPLSMEADLVLNAHL